MNSYGTETQPAARPLSQPHRWDPAGNQLKQWLASPVAGSLDGRQVGGT